MMKFSYLLAPSRREEPFGRGGAVEDCDGEGRHAPPFPKTTIQKVRSPV